MPTYTFRWSGNGESKIGNGTSKLGMGIKRTLSMYTDNNYKLWKNTNTSNKRQKIIRDHMSGQHPSTASSHACCAILCTLFLE